MQFHYRLLILMLVPILSVSCGQKTAGLQESAVSPDKQLFDNGMGFLGNNNFIKARLAFQTLINTYPDSEYTPVSFLAIADSYYDEGGTQNLLQSESQYKDFNVFYPTHEMADDAQMKVAAINVRLMRAPDRDPTYARKAELELRKFLEVYPDSELAPTAMEFLRDVQQNLATGMHAVGDFYYEKESYLASESRYKEILEKYPEYHQMDLALFRLGGSLENLGRVEEASVYYARLVAEYPFSSEADSAEEKLILLEKPVPIVDTLIASRNDANRKIEEGFSILSPIRSVVEIFTSSEDIYEIAKRRAEERRILEQEQFSTNDAPAGGESQDR